MPLKQNHFLVKLDGDAPKTLDNFSLKSFTNSCVKALYSMTKLQSACRMIAYCCLLFPYLNRHRLTSNLVETILISQRHVIQTVFHPHFINVFAHRPTVPTRACWHALPHVHPLHVIFLLIPVNPSLRMQIDTRVASVPRHVWVMQVLLEMCHT